MQFVRPIGVRGPLSAGRWLSRPDSEEIKMRRVVFAVLVVVIVVAPLRGQDSGRERPGVSARPLPQAAAPRAEQGRQISVLQKLRYVCKRLGLDARQREHAEGVLAMIAAEAEMGEAATRQRMEDIMSTYQAMQAAQDEGDEERASALREELIGLAPGTEAQRKFVERMTPVLNEEQQARLATLLEQLKEAKLEDVELKPIEVLRLARQQNLTAPQATQLRVLQDEFRRQVESVTDADAQSELLDKLIRDISGLLTGEQRAGFSREIESRRLDWPGPTEAGTLPAD
jgi:hypothetical protein